MVRAGNPEFGGVPLVLGSTYGYRSFEYDWLGRLEAISNRTRWLPGENIAECSGGYSSYGKTEHVLDDCTCGFYAFTDGTDHYSGSSRPLVDGVIEAYGRTVIGTKGTRSEKARIVALHMPSESRHNKILRWYQRHSIGVKKGVPVRNVVINGVFGGMLSFFFLVGATLSWNLMSWLYLALAILLGVNSFYGLLAENHPTKPRKRYMESVLKGDEGPMARIRANYPDAKIFTSKFKMRRAFPIKNFETEKIDIPRPETHEDFWKMETPREK